MKKNQQGKRAEEIFGVRITQDYIFRACALGEKWPVSDYYVEVDNDDEPFFFIAQVKSSSRGYDWDGNLKISATREKLNQLATSNAPTFIAGVDIAQEKVYLRPYYKKKNVGLYKISDNIVLDVNDKPTSKQNLKKLMREVKRYWRQTNTSSVKRNFNTNLL